VGNRDKKPKSRYNSDRVRNHAKAWNLQKENEDLKLKVASLEKQARAFETKERETKLKKAEEAERIKKGVEKKKPVKDEVKKKKVAFEESAKDDSTRGEGD
jgi:hypothetical protein